MADLETRRNSSYADTCQVAYAVKQHAKHRVEARGRPHIRTLLLLRPMAAAEDLDHQLPSFRHTPLTRSIHTHGRTHPRLSSRWEIRHFTDSYRGTELSHSLPLPLRWLNIAAVISYYWAPAPTHFSASPGQISCRLTHTLSLRKSSQLSMLLWDQTILKAVFCRPKTISKLRLLQNPQKFDQYTIRNSRIPKYAT
ncbi:hypothetical protein J6590_048370 [Homalodisca vitripennis]|nr:hypothetical protein J6590_048370 [Homalodisca vitripennis]